MSQRANPTLIGTFVVVALALAVGGLLLLGSGKIFHRVRPFILYLEDDVGGLSIGSAVRFQGVQIGSVTDIRLLVTPEGAARTIIPPGNLPPDHFECLWPSPAATHLSIGPGPRATLAIFADCSEDAGASSGWSRR